MLRVGVLGKLRAYFFAGILVMAPIAVTIALALWFIDFVDSHIVPLIPAHWNPNTYIQDYFGVTLSVPGVGVVVLVIAITLVGALTAGFLGRFLGPAGSVCYSFACAVHSRLCSLFKKKSSWSKVGKHFDVLHTLLLRWTTF